MTVALASTRVMNLAQFLHQTADRFPDEPALIRCDDIWIWSQMRSRVENIAAALAKKGIAKGDRVLVQSRNSLAMFESMFVCWTLGAVWVPVNFRLKEDEVAFIAANSGAVALFYESIFSGHADAARDAASIELVVSFDAARHGEAEWKELAATEEQPPPPVAVDRDDPCWFFFTSGTTGKPKAAVLTHGQMGFVITNHLADLMPGLGAIDAVPDCSLVVAPLSHGAGIHQLVQVARGVATVLTSGQRFDAEEIFALIERHRVTNMFTVPTILKNLARHEAVDRYDHSSLRQVIYAGAPMRRADQISALEKLGGCLVQYFGLGEVTGNITVLPAHLHDIDDVKQGHIGSCGTARAAMHIQIQDDEGSEVPRGETGEICVTGLAVFAGYWNNPDANEKAFRNGWFRTGDLGYMDGEGFLHITGRASDMFISGGSNIYPLEIEEKLAKHPDVQDVAVFGMPDEKWGEIGVAAIVARNDTAFDMDAFQSWMRDTIASYKVPRRVELFDALPVSGYGKVTKTLVRAAVEERDHRAG